MVVACRFLLDYINGCILGALGAHVLALVLHYVEHSKKRLPFYQLSLASLSDALRSMLVVKISMEIITLQNDFDFYI